MESINKTVVLRLLALKKQRNRAKQVLNLLEEGLKINISNYLDLKRTLDSIVEDYNLLHTEMKWYIWNKMTDKFQTILASNGFMFADSKVYSGLIVEEMEKDYTVRMKFPHGTHPTCFIELRFNYAEDGFENDLPYLNEIVNREFKAEFMEAYGELI